MSGILLLISMGIGLYTVTGLLDGGTDSQEPEDDTMDPLPLDMSGNILVDIEFQDALSDTLTEDEFADIEFLDAPLDVDAGDEDDFVAGGSGDDELDLGDGDDIALGGAGDDVVDLGAGDDQYGVEALATAGEEIFGNVHLGDDTVSGGAGSDQITDIYGSNTLDGGDGNDLLQAFDATDEEGVTADHLDGGAGDDVFIVDQGDTVVTGTGNDDVRVLVGDDADDIEGSEVVVIEDFDIAADALQLGGMFDETELSVEVFEDGTGSTVLWNDTPIVRVIGGGTLTLADILIAA